MGMNNVWYPYVEMADDPELKTQRGRAAHERLRHPRRHRQARVRAVRARRRASSASASSACGSHYKLLKESGVTAQQLRDVGRIAAVVNAAAQVIAIAPATAPALAQAA